MVTPRGAELPSCCAAFGDGGLVGLAIFGRDVVWLMLGSQWMPMVGPLIWLCFLGWFRTLTQTFDFLNIAIGKPETEAKLRAVELVLFVAGIIPAIRWYGASGTAAYLFLIYVISFLLHVWATHSYVRGVSQAVVTVWVSFAPLYAGQALFGWFQWHQNGPSTWPGAILLGRLCALFVLLFLWWKERELLANIMGQTFSRQAG